MCFRTVFASDLSLLKLQLVFYAFAQIIYAIKNHNNPSITGNIEDICDRIFHSVDKNNDSKFLVYYETTCSHLVSTSTIRPLMSECPFGSLWNRVGQISLEEFIEGAERDPWVMDQLKLDIQPCDWFIEQQEKNP